MKTLGIMTLDPSTTKPPSPEQMENKESEGRAEFERAVELAKNTRDKNLLRKRIADCRN